MKRFRQLILGVFLALPMIISAQEVVKGKVTDKMTGEELPGVSVVVKGTTKGTATDFDGNFELEVPEANNILVFSFVGYADLELEASPNMQVGLEEAMESLAEVVLIGYGQTTKKDATGAVESVTSKEFNAGAIASPEQLITGKTAGVNVVPPSGQPGESGKIKIRGGVSSLSASNNPLIVIDGVPVDQSGPGLNTINPSDIESFSVLKDASATAIYGSRATNGVILITTKSGKMNSDFNVGIDSKFSVGYASDKVDVLSADQFRAAINSFGTDADKAKLGNANTDWQDQIYQTAFGNDTNLTIAEGFDNTSYRASIGHIYQEGILKTSKFNRTSLSLNLRQNLFDSKLKMDFNIRGAFTGNDYADQGAIGSAISFDPTQEVYSGNANYGGFWEWLDADGTPNSLAPRNPLGLLKMKGDHASERRIIGNAKFDYRFDFLEGLSLVANFGFDYFDKKGEKFTSPESAAGFNTQGSIGYYDELKRNVLADVYLNYVRTFNDVHKIDAMLGQSFQDFYRESFFRDENGDGFVNSKPFATTNALLSYMARVTYGYDNRYLVTATFRRDGSSRFSPENRWGNFFSAAVAWNISEEAFLVDNETLSTLKLRLGYGETGQQEIGKDFPYLPVYTPGQDDVRYPFGSDYYNTIRPAGYDADIKWESSATYNIGLDYGFLNDRITGSIEYFTRAASDILSDVSPPAGSNLTNRLYTNIGDVENYGVEFSINADIAESEDFQWKAGFNATYLNNTINKLNAVEDPSSPGIPVGGISGGVGNTVQTHKVGEQQFSYLVYQQVYDTNGKPIEGVYVDRNGDGMITDSDKRIFRSPNPDYVLGFNSYMNYKNFDLNFTLRSNIGNYVYNNIASSNGTQRNTSDLGSLRNAHVSMLDTGFKAVQYWSDYYVQEASFLKMDNIVLGYNFQNLSEGNTTLRLYTTVQNVFTITDYDGIDPEIDGGIDNNLYPRPRTFLVGFNLNF